MTTPVRRGFRRIAGAPHVPIALYLGLIGAYGLLDGYTPALNALPAWLVAAWSSSLIVGTGLITWGVMGDRTRAESTGHMFHLLGIAFYVVVHLSLIGGTDVATVAVLAGVAALRMRILARSRAADREAVRIRDGRA